MMTVGGRVLDQDGKPVKGAVVELVESARIPWVAASEEIDQYGVLGESHSEGDGRFRLEAPRTSSDRVYEMGVIAAAPGYGLGWVAPNPDAEQPAAEISLRPEQALRIRLVELTGAPAKGVEIQVLSMSQRDKKGQPSWIGGGRRRGARLRSWPRPVKTDDEGRVTLSGLAGGVNVKFGVNDIRYVRQDHYVEAANRAAAKETTLALEPARIIEGRVLAGDTGQPISNAIVSAQTWVDNEHGRGFFTSKFRADAEGRFVMNPIAGEKYTVGAFPTGGEPYLISQDQLNFTKAQVKATHDIKLRRGVLIRGKVTDATTGHPLPGCSIQYVPLGHDESVLSGWQAIVASDDIGSFQIAVSAAKGHLLIFGPTGDYILGEIGSNRLFADRPGGQRHRACHHPVRGQGGRRAPSSGGGISARGNDQGSRRRP